MDNNLLNEKRWCGDLIADQFTAAMFENPAKKIKLRNWLEEFNYNKQFDNLPDFSQGNVLFLQANKLPVWANEQLITTGGAFFAVHAEAIMSLLGLLSLPYCYTAAHGAMVLFLSERIKNDTAKR